MVVIHFQKQDDLQFLYMILQKYEHIFHVKTEPLELHIHFKEQSKNSGIQLLQQSIKKLIFHKKQAEWCKAILEKEYFYTDPHEQEQIVAMLLSILKGRRKEIVIDTKLLRAEEHIEKALNEVLRTSHSFSFDAFLTFRLRFYIEKFPALIETAIDEYKLEQDYQMFIHFLRKFLQGREAQMECVYIINGDEFIFFDESMQEMKRNELNKRIDRKLLSNHPIYIDSTTIAPLISIAPKKVFLYTDEPEQGIIQTLKNIFEENITIEPLQKCNLLAE